MKENKSLTEAQEVLLPLHIHRRPVISRISWFRFLPNHRTLEEHIEYLFSCGDSKEEILAYCLNRAIDHGHPDNVHLKRKISSSIRTVKARINGAPARRVYPGRQGRSARVRP
jgi:hypothetical protein